jgi:hypothetical protein
MLEDMNSVAACMVVTYTFPVLVSPSFACTRTAM